MTPLCGVCDAVYSYPRRSAAARKNGVGWTGAGSREGLSTREVGTDWYKQAQTMGTCCCLCVGRGSDAAGAKRARAVFTAVPPTRARLYCCGTLAVGRAYGWNAVTMGEAMTGGVWEWEVRLVGGSNTCQLAVFEGPPASTTLPNASDENVLCTSVACTMRYVRGASDTGPSLGVRAGQRLRMRYVSEAGTVDVSVDGRPAVRAFDGVRPGAVHAGFFLSAGSKLRLLSFTRLESRAADDVVRGELPICVDFWSGSVRPVC